MTVKYLNTVAIYKLYCSQMYVYTGLVLHWENVEIFNVWQCVVSREIFAE